MGISNWKENKVIGIIAGAAFVISMIAVGLFIFKPKGIEMDLISKSSGEVTKMKVAAGAEFPVVNPKTGENDLYPATKLKCPDGYEFFQMITLGETAMYTCPKDPSQEAVPVTDEDVIP